MSVVTAVTESTERYLQFLTERNEGVNRHSAARIERLPDDALLGGSIRPVYSAELPPHLSLRQDTTATLILNPAPDKEIEIHLLTYDRSSGQVTFATREEIGSGDGQVLIDFRRLVKRCLEWFRVHGASLPDALDAQEQITNPEGDGIRSEGVSDEQWEAIRAVLTEPFSYIWGPPGTGKTQWVLSKAVAECVRNSKKVIVLASTNLAVDNALTSILKEGIPEEQVLRLGVPGPQFIGAHPECW